MPYFYTNTTGNCLTPTPSPLSPLPLHFGMVSLSHPMILKKRLMVHQDRISIFQPSPDIQVQCSFDSYWYTPWQGPFDRTKQWLSKCHLESRPLTGWPHLNHQPHSPFYFTVWTRVSSYVPLWVQSSPLNPATDWSWPMNNWESPFLSGGLFCALQDPPVCL
jgi:hypothetical protein